jgi:hypothetical protein|tara:strand:- start:7 stop:564 length:558 start_codon:yes stop_codon:yes gene_type:complete
MYVGRFSGDYKNILDVKYPDSESAIKYFEGQDEINKNKEKYYDWGYVEENTKFSQIYDDVPKECYDITKLTGLDNTAVALFKQPVGQVNPWHYDTNSYLVSKYGIEDKTKIYRYLIFLEDWDIGQILQIDNEVVSNWKQGDCYTWEYGTYHLSMNGGRKTKYTMQITGVETEDSLHLKGSGVWTF